MRRHGEIEGFFRVVCVEVRNGRGGWKCKLDLADEHGRGVGEVEFGLMDTYGADVLNMHRANPGRVLARVFYLGVDVRSVLVAPVFAGAECAPGIFHHDQTTRSDVI